MLRCAVRAVFRFQPLSQLVSFLGGLGVGVLGPLYFLQEEARLHRIGFKEEVFGPPGLAPPQQNILNSEGRQKYFR